MAQPLGGNDRRALDILFHVMMVGQYKHLNLKLEDVPALTNSVVYAFHTNFAVSVHSAGAPQDSPPGWVLPTLLQLALQRSQTSSGLDSRCTLQCGICPPVQLQTEIALMQTEIQGAVGKELRSVIRSEAP